MTLFIFLLSLVGLLCPKCEETELVFVGDAMQHGPQISAALRAGGGKEYDYSDCFKYLALEISSAHFAVANLECPLGGKPYSGYPQFSAPDTFAYSLKKAGFDLLLTANNHCLDRGASGLQRTIATLDSLRMPHIGTYNSLEERGRILPCIKKVNGIDIAFLNYTYGTNGIPLPKGKVVDVIDRQQIHHDIAASRLAGADIVCVCMHWGEEYFMKPRKEQRDLADFLLEEGVDLVIGSHPHVVETMETPVVDGSKRVVVYSLGNFISNQNNPESRGGAMVKVKIAKSGKKYVVRDATMSLFYCQKPVAGKNYILIPESRPDLVHPSQKANFDAFIKATRKTL